MVKLPAQKLTCLLSTVALLLLLLLLAPVSVSAPPMHGSHLSDNMMSHGPMSSHADESDGVCWQQCLSSCTSHCTPVAGATLPRRVADSAHAPMPPNLYQPIFPSGLRRPPKA